MKLPCIYCGDDDATITVEVNGPGAGIAMRCSECDHEFSAGEARKRLADLSRGWTAVLDWLQTHPERAAIGKPAARAAG